MAIDKELEEGYAELDKLLSIENDYWKIRSKSHWLKVGDSNTSYFHHHASYRRRRNEILSLKDSQGNWVSSFQEISLVATKYFEDLFTASCRTLDFDHIFDGVHFHELTRMEQQTLMAPYTLKEVEKACFAIHPSKSPGPDGIHAGFYHTYWSIVGKDITLLVLKCLHGELNLKDLNATCIALIPKTKSPESMNEFRPISLCNVIYKIISKVLVNRIKPILSHLIRNEQSAFVRNRLITDNIIVATEGFHWLRNGLAGKQSHMFAVKADMSKAYDRIEWDYLGWILERMRFPLGFRKLILKCVSTVTFQVLINGKLSQAFLPSRGLRQGDPLSPYLFILCAEGLSGLIKRVVQDGN